MQLTEAERQAVDEFLSSNWSAFEECAASYLSVEEIEALGQKLSRG